MEDLLNQSKYHYRSFGASKGKHYYRSYGTCIQDLNVNNIIETIIIHRKSQEKDQFSSR